MKKNQGFTLIELLVVIAIIGVLATVVLSEVNKARARADDSVVKEDMSSIRTQASIWYQDSGSQSYNTTGSATSLCDASGTMFSDEKIVKFIAQINSRKDPSAILSCFVTDTGDKWSMSIYSLKSGEPWCVDSTGLSISGTANNSGVCS